jgi:hypothetical protein
MYAVHNHNDLYPTIDDLADLRDGSNCDHLHRHSRLVAPSGGATGISVDEAGNIALLNGTSINEFSTDTSMTGNSDSAVPTEKAVRGYVNEKLLEVDLTGMPPVGSIVPWLGGYFQNGSNGAFTNVLGNTEAACNSFVEPKGWKVCNGAETNIVGSPIFDGTGRYLPDLTDNRFIQGDTAGGSIGGDNSADHTHTVSHSHTGGPATLSTAQLAAHTHGYDKGQLLSLDCGLGTGAAYFGPNVNMKNTTSAGSGSSHSHSVTSASPTSSGASNTENRPKFLSCFYIMRVQ